MNPITYIALDVGRGHLMMAGTVHGLLIERGFQVQTYTLSEAAQRFYRGLTGDHAHRLSPWFRFAWHQYDLRVGPSTLLVLHYFLNPFGFAADLWRLRQPLAQTSLLLNDIHPTGLLLPFLPFGSWDAPVIHILSENSLAALKDIVSSGWWCCARGRLRKLVDHVVLSGQHVIINTLDTTKFFATQGKISYLPPLLPSSGLCASPSRHKLRFPSRRRSFVAYLNPLFRDPILIRELVEVSRKRGAHLYLVSEFAASHLYHLAGKDVTIVAYDFHLRERLMGADLYVSGAGLAAPMQAYVAGVPFVGLVSRQPEHVKNALAIERSEIGRCLPVGGDLSQIVDQALTQETTSHPEMVQAVQERWLQIIQSNWKP